MDIFVLYSMHRVGDDARDEDTHHPCGLLCGWRDNKHNRLVSGIDGIQLQAYDFDRRRTSLEIGRHSD